MHINPDNFLQTEHGRVITPELNRRAWILAMEALRSAMAGRNRATVLYLLVGAQGAGKTTWLRANQDRLGPDAAVFDAILVKRSERQPLLDISRAHDVPTIAVWLDTPLESCLFRNAHRPVDEIVPDSAIRNVHAAIEPPIVEEGFLSVQRVIA